MTNISNDRLIKEGLAKLSMSMGISSKLDQKPEKVIKLSKEQEAVVYSEEPNILVSAAAGSGKTRVLVERIRHLVVDKNVEPSSIVAITFTNMAAEELKSRLAEVPGIGDAFIGTIHSFASRIYKTSGEYFKIYNQDIEINFVRYLIDTYAKYLTMDKYLKYLDLSKKVQSGYASENTLSNFLLPSERYELLEMLGDRGSLKLASKLNITQKYILSNVRKLRKEQNMITFSELLDYAMKYYKSIGARADYVLVDEFQDIGPEYEFIKGLKAKSYFFVGDDWQSIYGFKGGDVNIFRNLSKSDDFKLYKLEDNYRNGIEILEVADKVISQVPNRLRKKIKPIREEKGKVVIDSRSNLSKYLSDIGESGNYRDWFILTRNNKELVDIQNQLSMRGIPNTSFRVSDLVMAEMQAALQLNSVKVLTVHSAKGLEAPNVIMYGNFPVKVPSYRINYDEVKVMYVGVTRAEDNLIILN